MAGNNTSDDDDDAKVALYLEACDEYQKNINKAHERLRSGFIELAHARQSRPVDQFSFDMTAKAKLLVANLELQTNEDIVDPLLQFGAWPPSSLRLAQREFSSALGDLVAALSQQRTANKLEKELKNVFQ